MTMLPDPSSAAANGPTTTAPMHRRDWLAFAGGWPMLPLAASLGACAQAAPPGATGTAQGAAQGQRRHGMPQAGRPLTTTFLGMPAPGLDDPKALASLTVGSSVRFTRADGATQTWRLAHTPFFRTGDAVPDGRGGTVLAGALLDHRMQPVLDTSVSPPAPVFSDCPDGSSLITLPGHAPGAARPLPKPPGVDGNPVFAVVQFEYVSRWPGGQKVSVTPSPMAVLTLDQHPQTGALKLVAYKPVDTSGVEGLWTTCGASRSPWGTHLSSEEYEPDATRADDRTLATFGRTFFGDAKRARAYDYGHVPEVTVQPDGSGAVRKHYCMGRISHELVQVMPDERTVLMGDDWPNGGLFMFVADRPRDLSAGTLYAAQWLAERADGAGDRARLRWIRLGHATSEAVRRMAQTLAAADIVDVRLTDPSDARYRAIPFAGKRQWVRFHDGQAVAAAFLETHRYAAWRGASLGFTKLEGTTVDARDRIAYMAVSRIEPPMRDGSGGIRSEGPYSGGVYACPLGGDQRDADGTPIDSTWVPVSMAPVPKLQSRDFGDGKRAAQDALGNFADPERISQPDNLKFNDAMRVLFIGEDSSTHVNNFLWAWHADTDELVRLASMPVGAESTGLHAVEDVNGFTYVLSHFQHPGDWEGALHAKVKEATAPFVRELWRGGASGAVGYLSGSPGAVRWPAVQAAARPPAAK